MPEEKRGNGRLKTNVSSAYHTIKTRIISCAYQPGQLISEKEIVDELGISRTPVREAVGMLAGEGLLEIIPKKGLQVPFLSVKRLREIYDVRILLESEAVRQAMLFMKPGDVDTLLDMDRKLNEAFHSGTNASELFDAGSDIHLQIAAFSNNETLHALIRQLRNESHRGYVYYFQQKLDLLSYRDRLTAERELLDNIFFFHSKFIAHLVEGDAEGTIHYIKEDLCGMKKLLTEL